MDLRVEADDAAAADGAAVLPGLEVVELVVRDAVPRNEEVLVEAVRCCVVAHHFAQSLMGGI